MSRVLIGLGLVVVVGTGIEASGGDFPLWLIFLLVIPAAIVVYLVARAAHRIGIWSPGDGHVSGRSWGSRW